MTATIHRFRHVTSQPPHISLTHPLHFVPHLSSILRRSLPLVFHPFSSLTLSLLFTSLFFSVFPLIFITPLSPRTLPFSDFSLRWLPSFQIFFFTAPLLSTRHPVTCSLVKEASWLWFVFLLRCRAIQSDGRLSATAPLLYLAEFQNIFRHVHVRVMSVATSQQGLPRERGGAAAEEKGK